MKHRQHRRGAWSFAAAVVAAIATCNPAQAQFRFGETFRQSNASAWSLTGNAELTAAVYDAEGSGWLRLTNAGFAGGTDQVGTARFNDGGFAANEPITVKFNYVSWGGTEFGADGLTMFLYDATQDMSGALLGGGLGYCGGAGGFLAIGLDEYGNFSNPADQCGAAGGGPGFSPQSIVLRGPESVGNPFVTSALVGSAIDVPQVTVRPEPRVVWLTLKPDLIGYRITAIYRSSAGAAPQTLFSDVAFPYAAPESLSVGFSGSTGGLTNTHEIQGLDLGSSDDVGLALSGPASASPGDALAYTLVVTNHGPAVLTGIDAPTLQDSFGADFGAASWTCVGSGGATCPASGTGAINTTQFDLPVDGSVSFTVNTSLSATAVCASTATHTASIDFGSTARYVDPNPVDNEGSASLIVVCNDSTPAAFSFAPLSGVPVSSAQVSNSVTLAGTNAPSAISIVGGEYSINGGPFTAAAGTVSPGATIVVRQTSSASGLTATTATLTVGGVSAPFTVTTVAVALEPVEIKSRGGSGAMSDGAVAMLLALLALRWLAQRGFAPRAAVPTLLAATLATWSASLLQPLHAAEPQSPAAGGDRGFYLGVRAGHSLSTLSNASVANALRAKGYDVSAEVERGALAGTLFAGYAWHPRWALEAGYTYLGRTYSQLSGTQPADLHQLLLDGIDVTRGAGEAVTASFRYRWPLTQRMDLDLRFGGYAWETRTTVAVAGVDALTQDQDGSGMLAAVGPNWKFGERLRLGADLEYFRSTARNQFFHTALTLEYRLGRRSVPLLPVVPVVAPPVPESAPAAVAPAPVVETVPVSVAPPPPPDADGDGVTDADDRCPGTPAGAKVDAQGCETAEVVLNGVSFDNDSAQLREESRAVLDQVALALRQRPNRPAQVRGYTDSTGAAAHNRQLSAQRAESVVDYLVKAGVPREQLSAAGFGAEHAVASNRSAEGRAQNRRVTIEFSAPATSGH